MSDVRPVIHQTVLLSESLQELMYFVTVAVLTESFFMHHKIIIHNT